MASTADRVQFSVTGTPGTGSSITVNAATAGFQTPAQGGVLIGDSIRYLIEEGSSWEIAEGQYGAGGVISRNVLSSSNGASPATSVSFSSAAIVSLIVNSDDLDYLFCAAS
jgi:hypothetical protein